MSLNGLSLPLPQRLIEQALAEATAEAIRRKAGNKHWRQIARPNQLPPEGQWRAWLLMAGRGMGKTRVGAEWVIEQVTQHGKRRVALVAETAADARDVMVEGESGIMACSRSEFRPLYEPSKRRLTWPNGAIATTYSGDKPDQLRGPQHDAAWIDELAKFRYAARTIDNLELGLRLGNSPRMVITTTPRPIDVIRRMLVDPLTIVTRGTTYENIDNLPADFRTRILQRYEGTRVGRQELYAEILDDVEGALWKREWIDVNRMEEIPTALVRVVVAIDPAMTSNEDSAETGIIVSGRGMDGRGYVIDDVSLRGTPDAWAKAALRAYRTHRADAIVAEVNAGGEMVEHTIRTVEGGATIPFIMVHASRGKATRAEPVSALYEQGRVSHVGSFPTLEDQMCSWTPGETSPDRMDALVHGLTELGISEYFVLAGLVGQVSPQSQSRFVRGELEGSRWGRGDESRSWHR